MRTLVHVLSLTLACVIAHTHARASERQSLSIVNLEPSNDVSDRRNTYHCINECNYNGYCTRYGCLCNDGYFGSDCSFTITELLFGQPQTDVLVQPDSWVYFSTAVASNQKLIYWVNVTEGSHPPDLFVRKENPPTFDEFDIFRSSGGSHDRLQVPNLKPPETMYLGIHQASSQAVVVSVVAHSGGNDCLNACSHHGTCKDTVCTCDEGHAGADCSVDVLPLTVGGPYVNASVGLTEFTYFSLFVNAYLDDEVNLVFNVPNDGSVLVFVQAETLPGFETFSESNIESASTFSVPLVYPDGGTYYVGVYGWSGAQTIPFSVQAFGSLDCPNRCSMHGTCQEYSDSCVCDDGFSDSYCRSLTDTMTNGQVYTGFVEHGAWNYYSYQSNGMDNLVVTVMESSGDCDLFVRRSLKPNQAQYDDSEQSFKNTFQLTVYEPGHELWWLGVWGFKDCLYNISGTVTTACNPNCEGTCNEFGDCICSEYYGGENCDVLEQTIGNEQVVRGTLQPEEWNFYGTVVPKTTSNVYVTLRSDFKGSIWLYADFGGAPSPFSYAYVSSETATRVQVLDVDTSTVGHAVDVVIGIYGSPLSPIASAFNLTIWEPPF